jgi:hypothetical protein
MFAFDPAEAKRILEQGNIDLAIIDIRLMDDNDEKDISGLVVAKETAPSIPKIILIRFPAFELAKYGNKIETTSNQASPVSIAKQGDADVFLASIEAFIDALSR